MFTESTIAQWLDDCKTNGINVGMPELLRYRYHSKALDLTPKTVPQARLSGSYVTRFKGRGMEFDESRHYQPGDDIRAIDWRVTARTGKTHTKVYREERERPVFIMTDLSNSMQFGSEFLLKAVQAAHMSALACWAAVDRGDKVGGVSFNHTQHIEHKPRSRQAAVLGQLHSFTRLQSPELTSDDHAPHLPFLEACQRLHRLAKPGSLVWVISDFLHLSERASSVLANMTRHCEVRAGLIYDPLEHHLPLDITPQALTVTDGTVKRTLVFGDKKTEQQYGNMAQKRYQHISQQLNKIGITGFSVSSGKPLLSQKMQPLTNFDVVEA